MNPKMLKKMKPKCSRKFWKLKKERKEIEIEERMEAEIEVKRKGDYQNFDEVVSGRITFPRNPSLYTPPFHVPINLEKPS